MKKGAFIPGKLYTAAWGWFVVDSRGKRVDLPNNSLVVFLEELGGVPDLLAFEWYTERHHFWRVLLENGVVGILGISQEALPFWKPLQKE